MERRFIEQILACSRTKSSLYSKNLKQVVDEMVIAGYGPEIDPHLFLIKKIKIPLTHDRKSREEMIFRLSQQSKFNY